MNSKLSVSQYLELGINRLFRHRYLIVVLFLLARYALHSTLGTWSEDFWEHSAVVRELMTQPWHPHHPQILVSAPHAFFSPYSLLVALFGLAFRLDSITALAVFGGVNFLLLSYGLVKFCRIYSSDNLGSGIAVYTLLLSLFLWGDHPWLFSGFYNIGIFNDILPYPSTFALGLSLLILTLNHRSLIAPARQYDVIIICTCSLVLIIHSLTAIFLLTGICCQQLSFHKITFTALFRLGVLLAASLLLSLCWPYFSMWQLIKVGGDAFHFSNGVMYLDVIARIWPTLMLSPVIVWQALKTKNRDLALILIGLTVIFIFGYFSTKYSYGRTIAFELLICNVLLAQVVVRLEQICSSTVIAKIFRTLWVLLLSVIIINWLGQSISRILTVFNSIYLRRPVSSEIVYGDLNFLKKYTNQYDLIFADVDSSWIIPTIAGKVVGTDHPLAFVPDWYLRKWELMQFYSEEQNDAYRKRILEKYQPKFLLIKKSLGAIAVKIANEFSDQRLYPRVFEDHKFVLIRLP